MLLKKKKDSGTILHFIVLGTKQKLVSFCDTVELNWSVLCRDTQDTFVKL